MNMFNLIKQMYDFSEANPEKIKSYHWALYITAVEKCNRLGWKEKFGLPTDQMMELSGITHRKTYYKARQELVDWGFIKTITLSKNHNSATIISIIEKSLVKREYDERASLEDSTTCSDSTPECNHNRSDSTLIIRPNNTTKDNIEFKNNNTNSDFLKNLIVENKDLLEMLSKTATIKNSEVKQIDIFLAEKFASKDFLKWNNENDLFKHYMNWFAKRNTPQTINHNLQKAERR